MDTMAGTVKYGKFDKPTPEIAALTGKDNYDPIHNPNGYVNLGTAVNALNETEIESWLLKDGVFQHERKWQHYHEFRFDIRIKSISFKNYLKNCSNANRY